eukprot:sb/3474182/
MIHVVYLAETGCQVNALTDNELNCSYFILILTMCGSTNTVSGDSKLKLNLETRGCSAGERKPPGSILFISTPKRRRRRLEHDEMPAGWEGKTIHYGAIYLGSIASYIRFANNRMSDVCEIDLGRCTTSISLRLLCSQQYIM